MFQKYDEARLCVQGKLDQGMVHATIHWLDPTKPQQPVIYASSLHQIVWRPA